MSKARCDRPATVTVVAAVLVESRYPLSIRWLPAVSVVGIIQVPAAPHVTVAPLEVPLSSTSASGGLRLPPVALFQWDFETTPAVSDAPIGVGAEPTKLMPMAPRPAPVVLTLTTTFGAVCDSPPLVPVTASEKLPDATLDATATVIADVPLPVTDAELNVTVVPDGAPLTDRSVLPANPPSPLMVTVKVPLVPG